MFIIFIKTINIMRTILFSILTLISVNSFGQGQTINPDLGDHGPSTITPGPSAPSGPQESYGSNINLSCNANSRTFTYKINSTTVNEGYIWIYPASNIDYTNNNQYYNPVYEAYIYSGNINTSTYFSTSWDPTATNPKPYKVFLEAEFSKADGSTYFEKSEILCRF